MIPPKLPPMLNRQLSLAITSFRTLVSTALVAVSAGVIWTILNGETTPAVGFPMLAICSTALVGIGMLRRGSFNVPAIFGTVVALSGAGLWLREALLQELIPGAWERAVWGLFLVGMFALVALISTVSNILIELEKAKNWKWWTVFAVIAALPVAGVCVWLIMDGA